MHQHAFNCPMDPVQGCCVARDADMNIITFLMHLDTFRSEFERVRTLLNGLGIAPNGSDSLGLTCGKSSVALAAIAVIDTGASFLSDGWTKYRSRTTFLFSQTV